MQKGLCKQLYYKKNPTVVSSQKMSQKCEKSEGHPIPLVRAKTYPNFGQK